MAAKTRYYEEFVEHLLDLFQQQLEDLNFHNRRKLRERNNAANYQS